MSTVKYTPRGSTEQTITLAEATPAQQAQEVIATRSPGACKMVTTSYGLDNNAAGLKDTYFFYLKEGSQLLTFKALLQNADTPANTALTATVSTELGNYLTRLENSVIPIQEYVTNCVKDAVQFNAADYDAQVKATDESKSRLDAITTPEQHVSYYDGWFPLFRPMKESALFGLFAVSIFMLLISVLIFLKMKGIEINIIMPQGSIDLSWMTKYLSYSVIGIGIGFAVAYILYKYYPSAIGM